MSIRARFLPDKHPRRWLVLLGLGLVVGALGIDYLLVDLYRTVRFPGWAVPWVQAVTLQFLPRLLRGAVFLLAGAGAIAFTWRRYGAPIRLP